MPNTAIHYCDFQVGLKDRSGSSYVIFVKNLMHSVA
jgi:hypothetical protein